MSKVFTLLILSAFLMVRDLGLSGYLKKRASAYRAKLVIVHSIEINQLDPQ